MNQVCLTGRMGKDPELRYTTTGKAVVSFSIALDTFTGSGEDRQKTTLWVEVQCWEKRAEYVSNFCKSGTLVEVSGALAARSWDKDGVTIVKQYVKGDRVSALAGWVQKEEGAGKPAAAAGAPETVAVEETKKPVADDDSSDLPF